jgi:hypothetical protein
MADKEFFAMIAISKTPPKVPFTIARLNSLKRGEEMVYYKGSFDADIARCEPVNKGAGLDTGAPMYQALLRSIRDAAWALAQQGMVRIFERPVTRDFGKLRYTEYVAVGL